MTLGQYLSRLCAEATTIINAPDYARDIVELHGRRVMIGIADDLRDVSLDAPVDMPAATVASHAIEQLDAIVSARSANYTPARSFSEAMSEMVENMTAAYQRDGAPTGIPSGLRSLDHKLGGRARACHFNDFGCPASAKAPFGPQRQFPKLSSPRRRTTADSGLRAPLTNARDNQKGKAS